MSNVSDLVLKFQEIVKDQDPHWLVREQPGSSMVAAFLTVETSYPLEPETCGEVTALFRNEIAAAIIEVRYLAGNPQRVYRKERV